MSQILKSCLLVVASLITPVEDYCAGYINVRITCYDADKYIFVFVISDSSGSERVLVLLQI